jgi:hypothetical protein
MHHIMEHRRPRVNTTSPIVLIVVVVETQKQPTGVGVTQSFDACITTTRVETVVTVSHTDTTMCGSLNF